MEQDWTHVIVWTNGREPTVRAFGPYDCEEDATEDAVLLAHRPLHVSAQILRLEQQLP